MPPLDLQTVIVTLVAAAALGLLVRRYLPGRKPEAPAPPCANCAAHEVVKPGRPRSV